MKVRLNQFAEIIFHDFIIPIEAGTKNIVMFLVRNSVTALTCSGLTIFKVSDTNIKTIPITDPGIMFPIK